MTKELDAIIFGATGFTGKVVVETAVELLKEYKWGIAGRNQQKLENLLKELSFDLDCDLSHIPIIVADVGDEESIKEMAKKCTIVLNCCGPYQLYGEIVVKACLEAGTHHVDISGEPQYVDGMQLKYHDLAKEKGVYIISSCAFESIASEMGVFHAQKHFKGTINSIEAYMEHTLESSGENSKAMFNTGTWESAIYAIKNYRKMQKLREEVNEKIECPELKPKLHLKPYIQKPKFSPSYFLPFPFGDQFVVERSQRRIYEKEGKRPLQFESYIGCRSFGMAIFLTFYASIIMLLAIMPCTYKILLRQVERLTFGRFTNQGPSVANQNRHRYSITFKAKGWSKQWPLMFKPNREQLTRVSGLSPVYGFTSLALILAAKTILKEGDIMPGSGGVLPPGAAFYKTNLIKELTNHKYGLKFEVLSTF